MPGVAFITIWWTNGFNLLLFIAGLRNIRRTIYDAAALDGAGALAAVRRVITLAADLAGHGAGADDPAHPAAEDLRSGLSVLHDTGRTPTRPMVMVQYIYKQAFQRNKGGYAATVAAGAVRADRRPLRAAAISARASRRPANDRTSSNIAGRRAASIGPVFLTVLCAVVWAFPLYWAAVTTSEARGRGGASPASGCCRGSADHGGYVYVLRNTNIARLVHELDHHLRLGDGAGLILLRELRLCDLAAEIPRPHGSLVDDPRQLHGAVRRP